MSSPLFIKNAYRPQATALLPLSAVIFVWLALIIPNRLSAIKVLEFAILPLEALLLGLILLIPGRSGLLLRIASVGLLATGIIIKAADMAAYQAFGRAFNPVLDARFPADGLQLLQGAIGQIGAVVVAGILLALLAGVFWLSHVLLASLQDWLRRSTQTSALALAAGFGIWTIGVMEGWPGVCLPFYQLGLSHLQSIRNSAADLETFNNKVDNDPYASVASEALFNKLKGKDVLVVFVESYGRTVLDKAEYASQIRPLLQRSSSELAAQGLFARSAYLTSPTYGGISWLAHGTLLSGLWINSQVRYDRLVMSKRPSLNRLFQRAGWRTVAVQPAHTMAWPQGEYFGYDKIYAAQDLGYRGQPFNWITMPDQYTLSAVQKLERKPGQRQSVMAEIALISSHAPWTPLPQQLDWNQVGDGTIFNQARAGDTPELVWQDSRRIREQYRKSIEYALANVVAYAKTYGDDNLVMLVLGDHQPAPFVTDESENHDVLVHLISRDPKVMQAVQDWHWSDGMLPDDSAPAWGMDQVRDRLIAAFSRSP
jgi:phosphoglycerol transferase MdoB-like AlkP superfamily enzyme